ncbi:MAG: exo-alpha-sialidase [Opitutaceae bacterium]|nr:exo-alpha-sialidase [Opitutaceae bacterium]
MQSSRLLFLFSLVPTLFGATPAEIETEIRRIDTARVQALLAGDVPGLRALFGPGCVYTHGSGRVQSGEDYLQLLERGDLRYAAMRYEFPPSVVLYGESTAVVHGRVLLTGQGKSGPANPRVMAATATYVKGGLSWRLVSFQNTPASPAPRFSVLSQQVAVKEVCAWPKLARLRDGTIVAAVYNQPSHGQLPGDVACWASTDGGLTWMHRGDATRHEGNSAWFNHALGLAGNGDLLVATSGWDYHTDKGGKHNIPLVPIVTRSSDGGRSWKQVGQFPAAPESGKAFVPFGNIERGDDGILRVAAYSYARGLPPPRTDTGYVIASADDGATWTVSAVIGKPEVNETDLFYAGRNRWLAAARNLGVAGGGRGHGMDLYVSDDNAATWRRHSQLSLPNEHPGDLLKLSDGRILLTFGDRRGPDFGVNAMISSDGGISWSPEFRIAGGLTSRDSGYPSSVQCADGTLVTAYYARGSREYAGYQMSVVRWKLEE